MPQKEYVIKQNYFNLGSSDHEDVMKEAHRQIEGTFSMSVSSKHSFADQLLNTV